MSETEYDLQKNLTTEDNNMYPQKILISFIMIPLLIFTIILVIYFSFSYRDNRYFICTKGRCIKCPSSDSHPECKRGSKSDCQKNCKTPTPPPPSLRYKCVGSYDNNVPKVFMIQDNDGNLTSDSMCNTTHNGWSINNGQCIIDNYAPRYSSIYDCLNSLNNTSKDLYSCATDSSGNPVCSPNPLGNLSKNDCQTSCKRDGRGWGIGKNNNCILGGGLGNYHNLTSCIDSLLPKNKSGCVGYYDKSGEVKTECVSLPSGTLSYKDCKDYACNHLAKNWRPNPYGNGCIYANDPDKYPYNLTTCLDNLIPQRRHA